MSLLSDVMTGGLGTVIETVGKLAGEFITTDKERLSAELETDKAFLADIDSARKHDAAVQDSEHASFLAKNVAYWLDLFIVSATFGLAYMILFKDIPQGNKELIYTMFGSLLTLCLAVVNFHRGSSVRSQQKDETISRLTK